MKFRKKRQLQTEPIVELVVVHGMGRQTAGQTLLEWTEPILQRMDWLAKGSPAENGATLAAQAIAKAASSRPSVVGSLPTGSTELGIAELGDDSQGEPTALEFGAVVLGTACDEVTVSIHYLDLEAAPRSVTLHVTEARWSEAFLPLSRTQIFTWGLGFVFRAVGRLLTYLSTVFWVTSRGFWGIGRVVALAAIVVSGVVVGVLTLIAVVFLALSGPLLIFPFVSTALKPVVDALVDFVGDVPAWTQRPTRAAAMRQIVAGAVGAARARAGDDGRVMVVAHSEGAAITANLLFGDAIRTPKLRVDTLVTVGSALSVLGRPSFTSHRLTPAELAEHGLTLKLNPVRAWAGMDASLRPRWLDFFATWDVVSSGPTSTGGAARRARWTASYTALVGIGAGRAGTLGDSPELGPEEHPVHNTASAFTDHQSYSANILQVIDPLARIVLGIETRDQGAAADSSSRSLAAATAAQNVLHVRAVKELGLNRLLVLILAALFFVVPTFADLFGGIAQGPADVIIAALKWLLQVTDGEGFWGWLFTVSWVPYLALIAGAAALLLWANGALWQLFETRLASSRYDKPAVPFVRLWGLIVRVPLSLALALALTSAGRGHPPVVTVSVIVGAVALIAAPWFGRIPRILESRTDQPR